MRKKYSATKSVQVLLSLMKQNGIKKVIASPGTTNIAFVGSIQYDPYFEVYSAPDERSAAYMACGLAAESGETIVLTCTGATASRNYLPGLTEAFYRKLPVLAVTASQISPRIGGHAQQSLDRSSIQKDVAVFSTRVPTVKDKNGLWEAEVKINKAIHALSKNGGGPVHLELEVCETNDFTEDSILIARKIDYYDIEDTLPSIPPCKVAIVLGNHISWSEEVIQVIEKFCEKYNSVVLGDHTCKYNGKYIIHPAIIGFQPEIPSELVPTICIYIGEISADYPGLNFLSRSKYEWRVSKDGIIRDVYQNTAKVFHMSEKYFFRHYVSINSELWSTMSYYNMFKSIYDDIYSKIPDLPFSNIWAARQLAPLMPKDSVIHFGILHSYRSWSMFNLDNSIKCDCNSGGFGIDGVLSTAIGASLVNPNKLYYVILGDLAFFYDMNSLGNRHVGKNVRILLFNNGCGTEFRNYSHPASAFGVDADNYIAAGGHYGNKSRTLVKHYAEDLGFIYLCANNKDEFYSSYKEFLSNDINKSIIFEVFTNPDDESDALYNMRHILDEPLMSKIKAKISGIIGKELTESLKSIFLNK